MRQVRSGWFADYWNIYHAKRPEARSFRRPDDWPDKPPVKFRSPSRSNMIRWTILREKKYTRLTLKAGRLFIGKYCKDDEGAKFCD